MGKARGYYRRDALNRSSRDRHYHTFEKGDKGNEGDTLEGLVIFYILTVEDSACFIESSTPCFALIRLSVRVLEVGAYVLNARCKAVDELGFFLAKG